MAAQGKPPDLTPLAQRLERAVTRARGRICDTWAKARHPVLTVRILTSISVLLCSSREGTKKGPDLQKSAGPGLSSAPSGIKQRLGAQKSQSSSSVFTALPITYEDPEPEKKSWFSSAFGDSAERIAGETSVISLGNRAS